MAGTYTPILLLAASLGFASPALAQYHPAPPSWGFGYEKFGDVRFFKARMVKVQARIAQMDRRHQVTGRSEDRLIEEANAIQRHLRNDAAFGLTEQQADSMNVRITRLERAVDAAYAERDRRLYDPYSYPSEDWRRDADQDRDRNDRDDRWEDDRRIDSAAGPPR